MNSVSTDGQRTLAIRNPHSGKYDYEITLPTTTEIIADCARLRSHSDQWSAQGLQARINTLQQWIAVLQEHRESIIDALIADTGRKTESELEFETIINTINRWCNDAPKLLQEPPPRDSHAIPGFKIAGQNIPYQLVGVISPWNFPLLLSLIDAIPALLAGSAVIIKPSEVTPRFIAPLMATIKKIPALSNVFHYIEGDGGIGGELLNHIDIVVFTGSVATGRKVGEMCAKNFIPAFLELGGKDPAIVMANANVARAAKAIAWGGLANAGQSCLSIERVYVEQTIFNDFIAELKNQVNQLALCLDSPGSGQIGPVIAERQAIILRAHLKDAIDKGARIISGGNIIEHGGLFCEPTILTDVTHDMLIMREETFGPILPVMSFRDEAEAISLANDSLFGLSAAVFAANTAQAMHIGEQLQGGAISINDCALTAIMHEGEKQSFKLSGMGGSRMGDVSIKRFFRRKTFLINHEQNWNNWWFQ
jgi:acyl-CoA reductase-like NAD-dependent aldehyde dehydrogenase